MAQSNCLHLWILFWLLLALTPAMSVSVEQSSGVDEAEATLVRLRRAACSAGDCKNGGTCWPGPVTATTSPCLCPEPYTGNYCTTFLNYCEFIGYTPCKNGSTCSSIAVSPFYSCSCAPGFTGSDCGINIDDCAPKPCMNGQCTDLVNRYSCSCYSGWEGSNCGTNHDDCFADACLNGGRCLDGNGTFSCDCTGTGYTGGMCQVNIDDCEPSPCRNGATCVDALRDYSCVCHDGYAGKNCSTDILDCIPHKCQNNGICYERSNQALYSSASLPPPFNGSFSYSLAAGFMCDCLAGAYGDTCSVNPDDCVLPGTNQSVCAHASSCTDGLASFTCHCLAGYEGANCSVDINECELFRQPCRNGAVCKDLLADYACINCPIGFGGKNCSVRLTGCDSAPCRNGATCEPTLLRELPTPEHDYRCICDSESDFFGRNCSVRLPSFSLGLGGNVSSASFSSLPSVSSSTGGDLWTIELRLLTLSPGAFLMLLGDLNDSATTPRLLLTIDFSGRILARLLQSNGSQIAALTSSGVVTTGSFVSVKMSVSISSLQMSLTVTSAVTISLSSTSPLQPISGQLIVGGFSGARAVPAPAIAPSSVAHTRSRRSVPALPSSIASSLWSSTTAFSGIISGLVLNGGTPLILGPTKSSSIDSLPDAVAASDSTGVVEGMVTQNVCGVFVPCDNGATCVNVFFNSYTCQCHQGYSGLNCSSDFPDCSPSPCLPDEICLERSDKQNYNTRFLPWPFNGSFSYEHSTGHMCIKSYGYWVKLANDWTEFRSSGYFYAALVLSGIVFTALVALAAVCTLIRSGHFSFGKQRHPTPQSNAAYHNGAEPAAGTEGAYASASLELITSHTNKMRQLDFENTAEGRDSVYDTTLDEQYRQ